jgi:HNH endonuclease
MRRQGRKYPGELCSLCHYAPLTAADYRTLPRKVREIIRDATSGVAGVFDEGWLTDHGIIVSDDWKSAGKAADVWNGGKPILGLDGRQCRPSSCDSISRAFVFGNHQRAPGGPFVSGRKGADSGRAQIRQPEHAPLAEDACPDEMSVRQREIGSRFRYGQGGGTGRRKPEKAVQDRILGRQDGRCLYCGHRFGDTVWRHGQPVTLRLNWDHLIPYAYLAANPDDNWAAACHVCNGIKSSLIFQSVEDARDYILDRAARKGYRLGSRFAVAA